MHRLLLLLWALPRLEGSDPRLAVPNVPDDKSIELFHEPHRFEHADVPMEKEGWFLFNNRSKLNDDDSGGNHEGKRKLFELFWSEKRC
jgi:hypothetical protein